MEVNKQNEDVDFKVKKKDILDNLLGLLIVVVIVGIIVSIINFFTKKN